MSKSLKKLIDINRLREFKNKLVGTGSAYVQTAAVDQTVAGTKTFSEPIVGSVTGSSGSCTGNAATATTATKANALASSTTPLGNGLIYTTGGLTLGSSAGQLYKGSSNNAALISAPENGTYYNSTSGNVQNLRLAWSTDGKYLTDIFASPNNDFIWHRNVSNGTAKPWRRLVEENATGITAPNWDISIAGSSGSCTGNAATATKLAAKRTIALSGAATGTATGFDGSGNITIPVTSLDASKLTGTASVSLVPAGVIIPFAGTSVPTGYLLCNGAAVSRKNYANLFAAIGTRYGAGNGSTTFNLPDARDRVLQGASGTHSTGSYIAAGLPNITGNTSGAKFATWTTDASGAFLAVGVPSALSVENNGVTTTARYDTFDASRSSSYYGASTKPQVDAIATNFIIKY